MNGEMQIRAIRADFRNNALSIFIDADDVATGKRYTATPLNMIERKDFEEDGRPALCIKVAAGQQLMDDLWAAGIRPTEGQGSAGQLTAVQGHLMDMRKIVSKKLGVEL